MFPPNKVEESRVSSEESRENSEETTQRKEKKRKEKKRKFFEKSKNPIFLGTKKNHRTSEISSMPKTKQKKEPNPVFTDCLKIYFDWFMKITGVPAKMDGAQGKALKYTIAYLKSIDSNDEKIIQAFSAVLHNYDKWSNFHKKQLKLTQINSNLPNIINDIKNGKSTNTIGSIAEHYNEIVGSSDFRNFENPDDSKLLPSE